MKSDQELLQAYKDGDGNAFTDFYNRHAQKVTQWVASKWKLPLSDIDIAVQAAFAAISRRAEIPDNPRIYLEQAAIQKAKLIKARKKKHHKRFTPVHEIDFDQSATAGDCQTAHFIAPEPLVEHRFDKLNRTFDRIVETLPPKQKVVMVELRKDNNLNNVASKLKLHRNTIHNRRNEAIENLKQQLA